MLNEDKSETIFNTSFRRYKQIFDVLMYAFILIGIDVFEKDDNRCRALRYIMKIFFYIASVIGLLTGLFHFGFFLDDFRTDIFSPILYIYSGLLLSFVLHKKKKDYVLIFRRLSEYNMNRRNICALRKKRRKCLTALLFYVVVLMILLIISIYSSVVTGHCTAGYLDYSLWISTVVNTFPHFNKVHNIFLHITTVFCCLLPLLMHTVIYEIIFCFLKEIMTDVKRSVFTSPLDIKHNQKLYKNAKNLIEFTDSKLKHINSFCVILFASSFYFYAFNEIQNCFHFRGRKVINNIVVIATIIIGVKLISEGGEIPVINQQILSIINESALDDKLISQRIAFILQIQQGMHLTVSGIIAVNKGWSLILIGSTITYSLLIKNL